MKYNKDKILRYWDDETVESMYDKNLLSLEINSIRKRIKPGSQVLDVGCGEGEGLLIYSKISNITDVVTKARDRYKFLTKGTGKANHQLSTHGADVVSALPDQESVKKLIAGAKSRKQRKKKKEKK